MTVHIFVSSTWLDLQPERQAVEAALHRLRETKFVGMEYFGSRDETTQRASLAEVDRAQVYIGIFSGRYGSGITEDEYRRARAFDLPCFIYCKDESMIPLVGHETDSDKASRLVVLKQSLRQTHTVTTFSNADELAAHVTADIHRWLFDFYLIPRLERAARGELPHQEARLLMGAIKDWQAVPPELLQKLKGRGFVIASGVGNVAIGGNVSHSFIITGDGNVIGRDNDVKVTKTATATQGATLLEFTALLAQLRADLSTINLDEKVCQVMLADIKTVEAEAETVKPSLLIIQTKLKSIETLTKSVESFGLTVAKLYPLITRTIEYAQHLFS